MLFPCPRPVPTAPTVYFYRDRAFCICFCQPSWSPLGSALAGTSHPPCSSFHCQGVLAMLAQQLSLLRQGWVELASHQTPCPQPCSRRRTSAAAVLLGFRRNITLSAAIGDLRRWCGTAPLHAAPAVGCDWCLLDSPCASRSGLIFNQLIERKALFLYHLGT